MKPFHQGRKAFTKPKFTTINGFKVLKGNPYDEGTKDHRDWEFGYSKAYYENLKLVCKKEDAKSRG